jgi:hypothetical protein
MWLRVLSFVSCSSLRYRWNASGFRFLNFLVKISAKVARADIVSYPMVAKGTSGWGCFTAFFMSWAATRIRSVDDICGMGKLCGKKSSVPTMRSLAVAVI